jgi:hypothetical protein
MSWNTTGTIIFFACVALVVVVILIEAITVARPTRPGAPTMEHVEYADAAAAAAHEEEQRRQEVADLYLYAVSERERMRMPPYVGKVDPEHTEQIRPALDALEETAPMYTATYASNGSRHIKPTRQET